MNMTAKPGVFTGWLWFAAFAAVMVAAWAGAAVILWLVYA